MKKIKSDGSKTLYAGGIFEVDKTSGGTVTRTVSYYPLGGAMRINISGGSNTLYYLLKDHLGSASVVTDASGNIPSGSEQRYYPYGENRLTPGTMFTDKLFTGQREITGLGIYHYGARFYSPKLGRFLSPDTIVPGMANPQALNRYSYVLGNPLKYIDPSGHAQCKTKEECEDMGTTPMGGSSSSSSNASNNGKDNDEDDGGKNCATGDICLNWRLGNESCDGANCKFWATLFGLGGTAADIAAFLINLPFAVAADIALILTALGVPLGPLGYGAAVAAYQLAAPISNAMGFAGLAAWTVQGFLTGESHIAMGITLGSDWNLKTSGVSGSISQDTVFSVLNDTLALAMKEPNVATIWSAVGAVYDVERNPLAPYLSSAPPVLPTVIQPNGSLTYNWQTGSLSGNFSLFP